MDESGKDGKAIEKPIKKVFVTAQKKNFALESKEIKKESLNTNNSDKSMSKEPVSGDLKETSKTSAKVSKSKKNSKPKNNEKIDESQAISMPNEQQKLLLENESKVKKNPRKRNKKKKTTDANNKSEECLTEEICENIKGIRLESPSLSVEAAPFIPGSPPNITTIKVERKPVNPARKPVSRPKPKVKVNSDLREVEVEQLKIRFSPSGFTQSKNISDDSITLQCVMPIVDPDFAYDLASIRIEILLPFGYPGTKESAIRPIFTILNTDLPSGICAGIERNMKWGLASLEGGILLCRPMLRYLEDNLEKWMVDSVRESAFKFVKPSEIKISEKPEEVEAATDSEDDVISDEKVVSNSINSVGSNNTTSRISQGDWLAPAPVTDQSSVGGTCYSLKLYFSTIRGIDLLTSQNLSFLACCDRCKFNFPVEALRPFVDRIEHCPKCTSQTKFYYKAQLVTPGANYEDDDEFESVLGSIRFMRAKPVDLLPSLYQCACSRCYGSEEASNSNASSCKIEKVKIGENIGYGCFGCHQKLRFQIDRIEWIADVVGGSSSSINSKQKANNNKKSGPTLSIGSPLPQNGACEHYKKSFRWYRFPCCGQAFPCDECHSKDPIAKDHPIEWANRFICGYCSREQSINIKECPECGKDTSAAGRRKSPFWEGGKGTRNQVLMSRKDSKKYKDYSTAPVKPKKKKPTESNDQK